jgi:hypothetical protein
MFDFLKTASQKKRYMAVDQFIQISQLSFMEYSSLHREGMIPIVKKNGESFVDLVALVEKQKAQKAQHEAQYGTQYEEPDGGAPE